MGVYKIGDRVQIVNNRVAGMSRYGSMDCWLGRVMTINRFDGKHYRMIEDNGIWVWNDLMISGLA